MAEAKNGKNGNKKNAKRDKATGNTYNNNGNGGGHDNDIHDNIIINITGDKVDSEHLEQLSHWIKNNRKEQKMTQKDVSNDTGIDLKYYQKLESPKIPIEPRLATLGKLAKSFGYDGVKITGFRASDNNNNQD